MWKFPQLQPGLVLRIAAIARFVIFNLRKTSAGCGSVPKKNILGRKICRRPHEKGVFS